MDICKDEQMALGCRDILLDSNQDLGNLCAQHFTYIAYGSM